MSKIGDIRRMTVGLGGMFTEFSQSYAQIKSGRTIAGLYTNDKANVSGNATELYVGGMCHIMSMFWIAGQVAGVGPKRTGFIEWVVPGGNSNAINMEAVAVLVAKTVMYKAKGPKAASQGIVDDNNFDKDFFTRYSIKPKEETFVGFQAISKGVSRPKDRFYMISYGSGTGGHACAAQSSHQGGYAYFDPNYGAAALFSKTAWVSWYTEYLRISTYSTKYLNEQSASSYKAKGTD